MGTPTEIIVRAIAVTSSLTLVLALLPPFKPECQPLLKRLGWFYVRYVLPAYLIILASEYFLTYSTYGR
jgi:hypothetical protein